MGLGPVEVLVVGLTDTKFNSGILPALEEVVSRRVVAVVDAVLFEKSDDGSVEYVEIVDRLADGGVARLAEMMGGDIRNLLSADDVNAFAGALEPGHSALALVLEHTWAEPLLEAVSDAGSVISDLRVPRSVVREVMESLTDGTARRTGRPGLLGTMARTAAVAGTADPSARSPGGERMAAEQAAQEQQTANQAVYEAQAQMADLETRLAGRQSLPTGPPPTSHGEDLTAKLAQLSELHGSGVLSDAEFAAAKAKLLA